jgi:hypothetical protein
MEQEALKELKRFNDNIEWLRKNHQSVPTKNHVGAEWIYLEEAKQILNRGRTWLTTRMLEPHEVQPPMNTNWFLIRGLDWSKEGKLLVFKATSIYRLKSEMIRMGAKSACAEVD